MKQQLPPTNVIQRYFSVILTVQFVEDNRCYYIQSCGSVMCCHYTVGCCDPDTVMPSESLFINVLFKCVDNVMSTIAACCS